MRWGAIVLKQAKLTLKLGTVASLLAVLLVGEMPALAKRKPSAQQKKVTSPQPEDVYRQAEKKLPKNYYIVYRLVDRIARANGLDQTPWRVVVTSQYEVNAYASEFNLLTFEAGLLDQFEGNVSALACVIGHEMGHHVRQHLGYGPAEKVEVVAKAQVEAEEAKAKAKKDAESSAVGGGILGGLLGIGGALLGGGGGSALQGAGQVVQQSSQQGLRNLDQTNQQIDQRMEAKIKQRITEINHRQEFEADESGYIYSVRAGFEPTGCLKTMEILGRAIGGQADSESHPASAKRVEKLEALMEANPPENLAQEGKAQLNANKNPLPYDAFSYQNQEGATQSGLQIKPRTGSSLDDLRRLTGN
jgi:predicted Zn-dependent protease